MGRLGYGHVGGSMSIAELLAVLYFAQMKVDPNKPNLRERDRLILSKGHCGPALYSTLALRGFFPLDWLDTLNRGGSRLPLHCDMNKTPGVDLTTGSLGLGLSAGLGVALGNRVKCIPALTYVILGDGEINEGQIWEAAMAAVQFRAGNLIAFVDYNKMQIDGTTEEVMDLGDITGKWQSFGWHVQRVAGHDTTALNDAIDAAKAEMKLPSVIILDTVKGKDVFFAEGLVASHHMKFDLQQAREAIERLPAGHRKERLER
jgi:transketolase